MNIFLFIRWDVDPEIFHIGPLSIRWYSLMFIVSFLLGMQIFRKMVIREGKPAQLYENIFWPVALATLLGARLGHFLFYEPAALIHNPLEVLLPPYKGLASHGAAAGILIGLYYFSRKNRVPYLWTLDRIVITVALSGFFIRIGNLMNSEIIGYETTVPWGFILVNAPEAGMVARHPTQIYEALANLSIFAALYLIYLRKKPPFRDGVIFGMFLILLFGARFFIEFLKERQESFEKAMTLDMGQLLSLPLVAAGIVLLWKIRKKGWTVPQIAAHPENKLNAERKIKGKAKH
ncbi:MAG: prolipoprotein diacylglyceryl transferase [Prevotellaceae bacterium]|jgi:prolipoprotein diacylglyceryl transferase|nr:prolipoprotein diacylglyceryl transferase [Prevotellaceae bacterium]